MKNEFFYENIDRLYAAAKEKHGERAEEALVNAVRKTAGKFKKLGEKAYITLLLQELGASAFYEAEESAPYGLVEKLERIFAERYAAAQKKSRLFKILGGAAAAVCLAVVVGLLLRPGDTIVTDGAAIKGAKAYTSGDFVLTNVHTVNDYIGFDGDFGIKYSGDANKEQAVSTVAPDGTVYLLTVCEAKPEEKINMQGLFIMTEEGWDEVCRFEQKVDIEEFFGNTLVAAARSFLFCDTKSNPIVFLYDYKNKKLTAYICDIQTGQTEAVAEVPVTVSLMSGAYVNITACADGENIYFAAFNRENSEGTYVDILVYNLEGREFAKSSVLLYVDDMTFALNAIAHHNDRIYLLGADKSVQRLLLCAIKDFTKETPELVYEQWLNMGDCMSARYDCASLYVDNAGTAYVFVTYKDDPLILSSTKHGLDIVSAEGESLFSKQYTPLNHIEEAENCGIFMGSDKTLYFIECYGFERQITVGTFTEDYDKISEAASFKSGIANSGMLQAQFISDPTGKNGVFVDLLGKSDNGSTVMQYGYMRLQLK